jgi:hypothetical protein
MLLFGLTTAFLFAMVQICGVGQRRWLFWPLKELGDADHQFLAQPRATDDKNRTSKVSVRATHLAGILRSKKAADPALGKKQP